MFSPGTVGALSASGGLAAKKAWDARRDQVRANVQAGSEARLLGRSSSEHRSPWAERHLLERAERLAEFCQQRGYTSGVRVLGTHRDMFENGLIAREQLQNAIQEVSNDFLAWDKTAALGGPSAASAAV